MTLLFAVLAFVFIIGLCIGSFLNVVILRALSDESIVFPASKCPKCQTPLKWWHNIPVISYICLGGKCAFCKEKISIQYPLIELFTAVIFTLVFIKFGFNFETLFMWAIASSMIAMAGTDIKEKVVFDAHTYTFIGLAFLNAIYLSFMAHSFDIIISSVIGAVLGALIMEICARSGYLIAGTRAFGEGDTFIAIGLGALLGWKILLISLALSVVLQVIAFLPIFIKGLVQNKDWKTLITFLAFVAYAIAFCLVKPDGIAYTIGAILLAILGILACVFILKGLKEKPENRTYMPFGPAMVLAGLIVILML